MLQWPAEAIWEAVSPTLPGFTVEVLAQVDSTNSELMRRARGGELGAILLVAERQSAGRGRLGRNWRGGNPGDSLMFSIGMPLAPQDWSGLSLAVGVTVAESLHPDVRLKWPNDLWISSGGAEAKLCGILIETVSFGERPDAGRYAVIGVGINIVPPDAGDAPAPAAGAPVPMPAAGLHTLLPGITAPEALHRVAGPLMQALQAFEPHGFAPFRARFEARDVLRDRLVTVSGGAGGMLQGTAHGVSETGALLVHTALGMKLVTSSEVSVRPAVSARPAP